MVANTCMRRRMANWKLKCRTCQQHILPYSYGVYTRAEQAYCRQMLHVHRTASVSAVRRLQSAQYHEHADSPHY